MAQICSSPRESRIDENFLLTIYTRVYLRQTFFSRIKNRLLKNDFNIFGDDGSYISFPSSAAFEIFLSFCISHAISYILSAIASLFDILSGFRDSAQIISVTRFVFPHPCRNPSSVDVFSGDLKKKKKSVGIVSGTREARGITRELH